MISENDGWNCRAVLEQTVERLIDRITCELVEENLRDNFNLSSAVLLVAVRLLHHRGLVTIERHEIFAFGQCRFQLFQLIDARLDANQHLRNKREEKIEKHESGSFAMMTQPCAIKNVLSRKL